MSIPGLTALGFTDTEDSQYFSYTPIDGAIKFETEGGLVLTRRRFTRPAGYIITTGFTEISDSDKNILDAFYNQQSGGAAEFVYQHPINGGQIAVRFDAEYKTAYKGVAQTRLWNVTDIKLRSA